MPLITPTLWFDHNLQDAAEFYVSVFRTRMSKAQRNHRRRTR
jgi:predicted 3-demethylubiquinone-9 3-methyltransferase (glyoxalase superfamily)